MVFTLVETLAHYAFVIIFVHSLILIIKNLTHLSFQITSINFQIFPSKYNLFQFSRKILFGFINLFNQQKCIKFTYLRCIVYLHFIQFHLFPCAALCFSLLLHVANIEFFTSCVSVTSILCIASFTFVSSLPVFSLAMLHNYCIRSLSLLFLFTFFTHCTVAYFAYSLFLVIYIFGLASLLAWLRFSSF